MVPKIPLCKDHHDPHLYTQGAHIIELNNILPFIASKSLIISKLLDLKDQASVNIHSVVIYTTNIIYSIQTQADQAIRNLRSFMNFCDKTIIEISSLDVIQKKIFYKPIEKALITENPQEFIDTLIGSNIILHDIEKVFTYVPSPLEHTFDNYSSYAVGFESENTLSIYPSNKVLTNTNLHWYSRILLIDFEVLLITGGCIDDEMYNNCYTLNLVSGTMNDAPSMKYSRGLHCITWLNGFPCVIGGDDGEAIIKTTEVLVGTEWKEIPSLNIARYSFTAINHNSLVFCLGGKDKQHDKLETIEKFEDNAWKILDLRLFEPSYSIGAMCLENMILMYGGRNKSDENIFRVYALDTKSDVISQVGTIRESVRFSQKSCLLTGGKIFQFPHEDTLYEIKLKMIFEDKKLIELDFI